MKVVTPDTMRNLDRQAIRDFKIPGLELMENAGRSCAEIIIREFETTGSGQALILTGKGNNGGDGHVIARLLKEKSWTVKVISLAERKLISGDAEVNLNRLDPSLVAFVATKEELYEVFRQESRHTNVIVDAMLGTGITDNLRGLYRKAVEMINDSGKPVISVDIPSGIDGATGRILGCAARADITVTFACAKLGHIMYPGMENTGRLFVTDIGIPPELLNQAPGHEFCDCRGITPLLRRRDRYGHKGNYGHCLFIAASTGKTGAAALCANSAVRAGSGLVTLGVPESLNNILELKTTEAMTFPLPEAPTGHLSADAYPIIKNILHGKDALAIGPGIGTLTGAVALTHNLLESVELPIVIDADGLNALVSDISALKRKKSNAVALTPHPGEMARLLGMSLPENHEDRIAVALRFARDYGVYLILKGARTIIAAPDGKSAVNGSGNPGMASGGMGDVLTGVVTSLLGQGYSPWDACRLAVFIHGYSADIIAETKGEIGITATDVQENIPLACKRLSEYKPLILV